MKGTNRHKGEAHIVVGGQRYTLVLNLNAMCKLEDLLSTETRRVIFDDVIEMIKAKSAIGIRAMIWAALQEHHPEVSLEEAGRIISTARDLDHAIDLLFGSATPDAADLTGIPAASAGGVARPRRAQRAAGIGRTLPGKPAGSG